MQTNLLGLNLAQLTELLGSLGEKPFRAKQLMQWMHQRYEPDFARMTDLAKPLRAKLAAHATIEAPSCLAQEHSEDGTRKWLLQVGAGNAIETVFIPETDRGTLCVSSQVGCTLECAFCATGRQGFNRNLSAAEIVAQLWWANRALGRDPKGERIITNVVFMGMGEPLTNFEEVTTAIDIMLNDHAYGLSRRRVTVSTAGIVPALARLRERAPVALAVSLHAPNDALRDRLVPINKKYPIAELLRACRDYLREAPREMITFEYVMLDGVNDSVAHARELAGLLADIPCKLNLIPFNDVPGSGLSRSSDETIARFRATLYAAGYTVTVRKTRGDDIAAACGQLAGEVVDRRAPARRVQPQLRQALT